MLLLVKVKSLYTNLAQLIYASVLFISVILLGLTKTNFIYFELLKSSTEISLGFSNLYVSLLMKI